MKEQKSGVCGCFGASEHHIGRENEAFLLPFSSLKTHLGQKSTRKPFPIDGTLPANHQIEVAAQRRWKRSTPKNEEERIEKFRAFTLPH